MGYVITPIRAHLAKALVRWVSRWWATSYNSWVRVDKGEFGPWWHAVWSYPCPYVEGIAIPLARRLDKEAMVDQMVDEGWWG